ncbi:MAG: response regulator, partial [Thermodesulfobacteriota bacterium]
QPEKTEAESAPVTGSATVLVAEDEAPVRRLATAMLEKLGYRVLAAENVDDVIAMAKEHPEPIALLLTDVVMPGMKGPEVFQRVAAHHPDIKVLYMSGYTDNVIVHHGILDDGIAFLQKPFSIRALADKVQKVLTAS